MTASIPEPADKKYELIGGVLCLDFCNTVGGKRGGVPRENLYTYDHFISWCEQAGLLNTSQAASLVRRAATQPADAQVILSRAVELREAIYRLFLAHAQGVTPNHGDLENLNSELARTQGRLSIGPAKDGGYIWTWASDRLELDHPLGPIAQSAGNLLTAGNDLARVRQCRGDNCGWLFIDGSKNHSRCWCDMRDCGNRAKVRRHRQRLRG